MDFLPFLSFSSLDFAPLRHAETIVAIYIAGPAALPAATAIKKSNIFWPLFVDHFKTLQNQMKKKYVEGILRDIGVCLLNPNRKRP